MKPFLYALLCLSSTTACADGIYKYVDAEGHVTYTNIPTKGAQRVQLTPLSSYRGTESVKKRAASAGDVQIDSNTQKQRDGMQRKILEGELSKEQSELAKAQQALADGKATRNGDEHNYQKYLDRIKQLQDVVTEHEKNIAAIKQELGQNSANAQK